MKSILKKSKTGLAKCGVSDEKMAGVHMGVTLLPLLYESITHRLYQKDTLDSLILFDRSRLHTGAKPTVVKT